MKTLKSFRELRQFRSSFPPAPARSPEELLAEAIKSTLSEPRPRGWNSRYERFGRELPNSRLRNRLLAN